MSNSGGQSLTARRRWPQARKPLPANLPRRPRPFRAAARHRPPRSPGRKGLAGWHQNRDGQALEPPGALNLRGHGYASAGALRASRTSILRLSTRRSHAGLSSHRSVHQHAHQCRHMRRNGGLRSNLVGTELAGRPIPDTRTWLFGHQPVEHTPSGLLERRSDGDLLRHLHLDTVAVLARVELTGEPFLRVHSQSLQLDPRTGVGAV